MDETIVKWIIEFLLRQKIDDKVINCVISSLPLANNDYRFKKTMLLRRIETETSNGCVSEKLLELIEIIEALDYENDKTASYLMKEAYCLVAVDCTVRFLGENVEENRKYMEIIEIVWKNRVCKSEGLFSELSKDWLDDIEMAVKDSSVCEKIWMRNTRNEALKAVKAFLKEAWECLGPSFLELAVKKVGNEVEGRSGGGGDGDGVVCSGNSLRELGEFEGSQKGVARRKHVAVKSKRQRGAKISDANEETVNKASDSTTETVRVEDATPEVDKTKDAINSSSTKVPSVDDHLSDNVQTAQTLLPAGPTPTGNNNAVKANHVRPKIIESCETVRMRRDLRNSTQELHAAVNDPLPEALQTAQTLLSSMATNNLETVAKKTGLDIPTVPEAEKAPEMAQKMIPNAGNDVGPSKESEKEMDVTKGSNVQDPGNVKQNILNDDAKIQKTVPNMGNDVGPSKQSRTEMDASKGSNGNVPENVKQNTLNEAAEIQKNARKRSLMDPNDTSHTLAWGEDEIENSSGSPTRPRLPSPKVQRTSPLKKPEYRNIRRRERKRWTPLEEDTLREGVIKYGRGSWKMIINDAKFAEVFQGRTDVDLKDKWRNLTKYS